MHRTASFIGTTPRNLFRTVAAVAAFGMVAGGLALVSADPASAAPSMDDPACQLNPYTANYPHYVVPEGVHLLNIEASGKAGGSGGSRGGHGGGVGGLGAHVTLEKVAVTPGQKIWAGTISGGVGGSTGDDSRAGNGGEGMWVGFANWSGLCIADGLNLLAVAGGGGGGGDGDAGGPGGTGGAAGEPGNPGGNNQNIAGGGGGAGTMSAPGAGGAGGNLVELAFGWPPFTETPMNPGYPGDDSGRGGAGNSTATRTSGWSSGGGGGGGIYGGGGGGASGNDAAAARSGTGSGGGGGGGSYPDAVATSTHSYVRFTPIYDTPIALSASPNPGVAGQPVTLSATVTSPIPDQVLGGGAVSFSDRGDPDDPYRQTISFGPFPVDASATSWTKSVTLPSVTRGYHQVQTYYSGFIGFSENDPYNDIRNAASRSSFILNVQGDQSITFTSPSPAATALDATYTPTATSTYGLAVRMSIDSSTASVCSMAGGVVSFLTAGTCTINANQAGDDITFAAPQVQQNVTVGVGTAQSITFTSTPPAHSIYGDSYTPTATGGASGNPVLFDATYSNSGVCIVVNQKVVHIKQGGTCVVYAHQAGGNGYSPAVEITQSFTVDPMTGFHVFVGAPPTSPRIGDTYIARGYVRYLYGDQAGLLTVDPASTACTLGPTHYGWDTDFDTVGTVTYTGVGTCIINGNSVTPGSAAVVEVAQGQQISTVAGDSQVISFTSTDPPDPTYGGSMTVTATGGDSGNPVTFATTTPETCTITGGSVEFVGVGDCDIAADQLGDSTKWGAAPTVIKTLSIAPAPLTVTAPSTSARHGAALSAFTPEYDGFVNGDDSSSLQALATCDRSSTSQDVGSYPVTCAGAVGPNYSISYIVGTATITRAPLTITASSATTGYGLGVPAVTASYSGFVDGDTATSTAPTCVTTATDQSPVGDYATSCSGAADPNYTITTVDGTLSITHATLVITPATTIRSYGDAAADITPTYLGFENDDTAPETPPTCTAPVDATTDVGDYVSTCSGADDPNYTIAYSDGVVHVTPAALTVVAPHPTTPYGTPVAAGLLDPQYVGLAGGDAAPATPATCLTTATPSSPVGTYPVDCSGAVDPNYTISYQSGAVAVATVPLTVTASSASIVRGASVPAIVPSYSGLVLGQSAPGQPATCVAAANQQSPVGTYPTTCSGATDGNYAISYIGGTLTIVAPIVVAPPATVIGADPDTTVAAVPPTSPSTAHDSPPASASDSDSQTSADGAHAASEAAGVLAFWLVLMAVLLAGIILAFVLIARRSDRAQ